MVVKNHPLSQLIIIILHNMKYYPKSRIITNLKSNPGQFITADGKPYLGPYYITFDGKSFTGNNPNDISSRPLIKILEIKNLNPQLSYDKSSVSYRKSSTSSPISLIDPTPFTPSPTEADYKVGKITRYFARQRNGTQFKVMEISKSTYEDMTNLRNTNLYSLWKATSLFWQISGPLHDERINNIKTKAGIIDTNQRILDNTEKNFIGIKQYLSNLQQFAKIS